MKPETKAYIASALFILSLPACLWTIVPSCLLFLYASYTTYLSDKELERKHKEAIEQIPNKTEDTKKQIEDLQTQINALNFKLGISGNVNERRTN